MKCASQLSAASEDAADLASCVGLQWADPASLLQSLLTPREKSAMVEYPQVILCADTMFFRFQLW